MASALQALLGASKDIKEEVNMKRLGVKFTIRPLSFEEIKRAGDQATIGDKLDDQLHNAAIIALGCVDPAFNDKSLREHYDATDSADCVIKALMPGEVTRLVGKILALSGYGKEEETIEDVKN
ncbi:phage tail assembly chaperone [Paenibacillus urinalis]|uniref:phage tail assembly chaperone n=1 Tax=Paenibacillus urinalis TaxID=521520 RepID=UPI00195FA8D2